MPLYQTDLRIGAPVVSGTSGSIPYIDSSINLAQDNANLFYDAATARLGLGVNSSLGARLHIYGAVDEIKLLIRANATQTSDIVDIRNSSNAQILAFDDNGILTLSQYPAGWLKSNSSGVIAPTLGSANQVAGINSAGTDIEFKSIVGTTNQVNVNHSANTITLSTPQDIHTGASPTFAQLNVDNLRLDGNTISSTNSNGDVVVSPNGTGAFNLTTETQNWLGTQMVIKDVLARDIITATGVTLTISHVNVIIDETIQCNGPIEVEDTIDLNKLSGIQLRVLPDGGTVTGAVKSFSLASTLTIDSSANSYQFVQANGEFSFTAGPAFGIPPIFFMFSPTIRASSTNMTINGTAVYYNQAHMIADGINLTFGASFPAFLDSPQFSVANGGTIVSTSDYACFRSEMVVNTGVTMDERSGWRFANGTGAGTITTQLAYFCAALTKGTNNQYLFFNGAATTSNNNGSFHRPNIMFGSTTGKFHGGDGIVAIANATTNPTNTTDTDSITLGSRDISAGNTTLQLQTEGTAALLTGQSDSTSSRRLQVYVNGTLIELLAV